MTETGQHSTSDRLALIANAVIFQVVWLACVAGGGAGLWWLGPASVGVFAAWHLPRSATPRTDVALAVIAVAIGVIVDTSLLRSGLLAYPAHGPLESLAPLWILALWAGFALTLNHSLAWLTDRPFLTAALRGLSGAFSYWIGSRAWGAVDFGGPPALVLVTIAAAWTLTLPALMHCSRLLMPRLDPTRIPAAAPSTRTRR